MIINIWLDSAARKDPGTCKMYQTSIVPLMVVLNDVLGNKAESNHTSHESH